MTKQGYKQTELGLIPKDWGVHRVDDFNEVTAGGTPSTFVKEYWGGSIRWMNSGELNLKKVFDVENRITDAGLKSSATKLLPKGCVLVGLAGQGKTRGTVAINKVALCTNQSIAAIYPSKKILPEYLYYNLDNRYKELRNLSTGDGGRGGLNLAIIKSLSIPLPPTIEEQTAIANALSDVDNLIDSLEKLIEKKKLIKQGALQKLLKPKEGLVKKKLGEIALIRKGELITNKTITEGEIPVIAGGVKPSYYHNIPNRKKNCITISASGASAGFINFHNYPIFASDCTTIESIKGISQRYLWQVLKSKQREFYKLQVGGAQPHVYPEQIKNVAVSITLNLDEQEEIADILSDMDKEIEHLQTKLNKYKQVKLGMMQNLLTGKIRLVQQIESIKPVEQSKSTPFDEATLIATFVNRYATKQNPITRFRYTKLLYLFHRYVDNNIDGFLKKAAGPYNPSNRYKGPEGILIKNKYAKIYGDKFYPDTNINEVEKYYKKRHGLDALVWLDEFSKYQDEHLELLATVDMATVDLRNEAKEINVQNVKDVIKKNPEWEPKLQRPIFSDSNIQRAIKKSIELFG